MVFPSGLLQGALERLGISATVLAESNGLPRCTFQIRTHQLPQLPPPSVGDQANASLTATATTMTIAPSNDAPMMASQQTARPSGHAPQTIESALTSVPSPAPTATQAQAHAPEQTQPSASPSPSPLHPASSTVPVHSASASQTTAQPGESRIEKQQQSQEEQSSTEGYSLSS